MPAPIQSTAHSADGTPIHCERSGSGGTALLFVHGWLGSCHWWDAQVLAFEHDYQVITMDLAGHGSSGKGRKTWTLRAYAQDIAEAALCADYESLVLVGHSMAGPYCLDASTLIPKAEAVVLVDTMKDLDKLMSPAQAEALLKLYRDDFEGTIRNGLPKYLFAPGTPSAVKERLQAEFLAQDHDLAIKAIEPLYKADLQALAKRVQVPVYGLSADFSPTNAEANSRYFKSYMSSQIKGTGHYPMLEDPSAFNVGLRSALERLGF